MPDTVPAAEVAGLIAAIRDALSLPDPAGWADRQKRLDLLDHRAAYVVGVLASAAQGDVVNLTIETRILRNVGKGYPVRYEVAAEGDAS